jgi:hypothetical protein
MSNVGQSKGCQMVGCGVTHFHSSPPEGYEWRWHGQRVSFGPNDIQPLTPGVIENGAQVVNQESPWSLHRSTDVSV